MTPRRTIRVVCKICGEPGLIFGPVPEGKRRVLFQPRETPDGYLVPSVRHYCHPTDEDGNWTGQEAPDALAQARSREALLIEEAKAIIASTEPKLTAALEAGDQGLAKFYSRRMAHAALDAAGRY